MSESMTRAMERARSTLSGIGAGQRILIGLVAVAVVMGAVVFGKWVTAPSYAPLYSNLASTDASAIVEELNAAGVKYELADGGQSILVDKDQVYNLRLDMSGKGLPAGDETGYALLDEQGITTSEFQQQIEYQRALEGELANTLKSVEDVRNATVHVALPKEDVFVSDTAKPTASVLLDMAPGATLDAGQIQAVTHLVSSSIEGMDPEGVTVADSTGQVLSAAGSDLPLAGAGDAQSQMEQEYEHRLADNAQQILDRIVGPGKALVRVRADLDFDATETRTETFIDPEGTPPLSESTTTETYEGGGAMVGGVLGPENQPDAGGGGGDSNYSKETRVTNNSVGTSVETSKDAPGTVDRLTVSVVLDQTAATALDAAEVEDLVANAVGLDGDRGDAITVAEMPFDTTAAENAAADLEASKKAEQEAQQRALIKQGVIAAIIVLFLLFIWWRVARARKRNRVPATPTSLTAEQRREMDDVRAELARRQAEEAIDIPDVEVERRRQVRSEIATMISDNPDEVAAMLRGWLSEEKA